MMEQLTNKAKTIKRKTETSATPPDGGAMPRNQREELAELHGELAKLVCAHCATRGLWKIEGTAENVRYVRCGGCGKFSKVATAGGREAGGGSP